MGYREYFMYSKSNKYTPEKICNELAKHEEITNSIDIIGKTEVIKDFVHLDNEFRKGTVGAILGGDSILEHEWIKLLSFIPNKMASDIEINMITFLDNYSSHFKDSSIIVQGKRFDPNEEEEIEIPLDEPYQNVKNKQYDDELEL